VRRGGGFREFTQMNKVFLAAVTALMLSSVAHADEASVVPPEGKWLAEDIRGGGVIDNLQTTLELTAEGRAVGSGGCNRFTGSYTIDGAALSFGPVASTRMACPPAVMDQEGKFFAALGDARGWRVDDATGKLILLDAGGAALVTLAELR
jgi:putative lipoprotein